MSIDLPDFLRARIAEDEETAKATSGQPWSATVPGMVHADGGFRIKSRYVASVEHDEDRAHIARWDPARVLAECEAKRELVALADPYDFADDGGTGMSEHADKILRALALPYANHADFREEWKP